MTFSKKTILYVIISSLFLVVSSYLIYEKAYVEPIKYDTYIEIYKNENDYRVYLKNSNTKKLVGYNLYKTIGLNLNGEEISELTLNTADNQLNGIIIHYKSDYYSYYNLENETNLFKELKLKFANWNKKFVATTKGYKGQFGMNYESIYDLNNQAKVLDNLSRLGQSTLYFLKSNNQNYFYIDSHTCEQTNTLCNKINIFNDKGDIVYTINNHNGYIVDFNTIPVNFNTTYEVNGYYKEENGKIKKYSFDGLEIKSNLYDEILFVGMFNYVDYNIVYKANDNYIYVIDTKEEKMRKVVERNSNDYCIVKGDTLHVYETSCSNVNSAIKYYDLNLKNNQVTEIILNNN